MINWILLVVKKIRDPKSLANGPEDHLLLQSLLQAGHSGCIRSACAWLYVKQACSSSGLLFFHCDSSKQKQTWKQPVDSHVDIVPAFCCSINVCVCSACQTRWRQFTQQVKCIFLFPLWTVFSVLSLLTSLSFHLPLWAGGRGGGSRHLIYI